MIENRIKQKDDFYHVNDAIRKTVDKFQWVFVGGFPMTLKDLIQQKKVKQLCSFSHIITLFVNLIQKFIRC